MTIRPAAGSNLEQSWYAARVSGEKISANRVIDAALQLDGDPERVRDYYENWAREYDDDVRDAGYSGPSLAADLLARRLPDKSARILDAGCGTGLVGIELAALGYAVIDGFDLSQSMARQAAACACYRRVLGGVDMMQAESSYPGKEYDAVLSIGVFTPGHVPPEALRVLWRLTRTDGLLLVSARTHYYERTALPRVLQALCDRSEIQLLQALEHAPYNKDGDGHYWVMRKTA